MQGYSQEEISEFQNSDPDTVLIRIWMRESNQRPMGNVTLKYSPVARNLWLSWDLLSLKDGVLYNKSPTDRSECLVVPRTLSLRSSRWPLDLCCANVILNGFIARFGIPLFLHSDQGRNYESDLIQQLCNS